MNNSSAYIELLKTFPPRPITAEKELIATQKAIGFSVGQRRTDFRRTRLFKRT
ncbi:hypothetical protein E5S67_05133 [Microcoleus sp. IPMA8]|uniref:Uncharacterized protein n=1 Tax=Microcoleus asticus IPMA8 TaxID=2563858 RepID=A0ABX2D3Y7_9CYAN|nr:hypothetical protein [Microcoleus asticus IPMA8]